MNPRELKHFLLIARGSNCELQTQLQLSDVLGFADPQMLKTTQQASHSVDKMLFALLGDLKNTSV